MTKTLAQRAHDDGWATGYENAYHEGEYINDVPNYYSDETELQNAWLVGYNKGYKKGKEYFFAERNL